MLIVPPPIFAAVYLLMGAGLSYLLGWPEIPAENIAFFIGGACVLVGLLLAPSAALLFMKEKTDLNPAARENRTLVTSGPFRFTRNPMYLGVSIATLGAALMVGSWPMLLAPLATFATANWVHIPAEEANMRRQFGDGFDAYARRVRRWL
jgi:protein-S-isoprenylcysteine O-methyltransferase Ste14